MIGSIKKHLLVFFVFLFFAVIPFVSLSQNRDDIIAPGSEVEILDCSFEFAEGPACDKEGNVYFSDIKTSRIYIWTVDSQLKIFRDPSKRANGLRIDPDGNLLACEGAGRRLTSTSKNGEVTVLADQYQGKKLNSPNDLWIDPRGGIYFTDPRYNARWIWIEKGDGFENIPDTLFKEEQETRALYYIPSDGSPLRRVAEGFENPNGVVGTKDGKKLYVSDTEKEEVFVFDILPNGALANRKVFVSKYSDGMTLDENNNLYLTNGGIDIYAPTGNQITTIDLPFKSSNVCFGGADKRTLFITARQFLFSIKMRVTGQ